MKKSSVCAYLLILLLTACSTKAFIAPELKDRKLTTLAILPLNDQTELTSEQVALLTISFAQELRNAGYLLLDPTITRTVCPKLPCDSYHQLFTRYFADAAIQLTVESSTRTNFLAGYYNSLSGTIEIKDQTEKTLFSASATEREKGGLLFNSGQLFQGLSSQIDNAEQAAREHLSDKFLLSLVAQIPKPATSPRSNADATAVNISSVSVKAPVGDTREVCVEATPQSVVSLLLEKLKTTLPEVSNGRYCRSLFLNAPFRNKVAEVEARSPYGNSVRAEVVFDELTPCSMKPVIEAGMGNRKPRIVFSCGESPREYLVYRESADGLHYVQSGRVKAREWIDTNSAATVSQQYVVIERSPRGDRSLPIFLSTTVGN